MNHAEDGDPSVVLWASGVAFWEHREWDMKVGLG